MGGGGGEAEDGEMVGAKRVEKEASCPPRACEKSGDGCLMFEK